MFSLTGIFFTALPNLNSKCVPILLNTISICCANSNVCANTIAWTAFLVKSILPNVPIQNVAVFPVPLCACAITSYLPNNGKIAFFCIGDGFSKPYAITPLINFKLTKSFKSSNDSIGTLYFSRRSILSIHIIFVSNNTSVAGSISVSGTLFNCVLLFCKLLSI